jgi:hypothetical protein
VAHSTPNSQKTKQSSHLCPLICWACGGSAPVVAATTAAAVATKLPLRTAAEAMKITAAAAKAGV